MSLFWDWMYLIKKTPWDTGVTPPEIVAMIESGKVSIGGALDLGCGTGTNAIYLAQHGFTVTAIDVSRRAVALAQRKTRSAQLTDRVQFERGDVTQLRKWINLNSIDFACDIGCFHGLTSAARDRYVAVLQTVLKPKAIYMQYSFLLLEPGSRGVAEDEIEARFGRDFVIERVERGGDSRRGRASAWYTLIKREA